MNKKMYGLASLLILVGLLLSACGNNGSAATPAPNVEAPAAVTQAPTQAPTSAPQPQVCNPVSSGPVAFPANGKSITGDWSQEPDNITPYFSNMSYGVWIAQMTLVGLAEWDNSGNFVPELAMEVPTADNGGISEDGLTITWKLKNCLYWSDGSPLTSADVKFTWETIMDPGNAVVSRSGYDKIASIDTPDDATVVITFSQLYPPWQTLFTQGPNNQGSILPKHILEGKTALQGDPFIHAPSVSSGPFVITEWIPGDHMTLLPNPNFYKGRAKLDQIFLKFVPDPESALAALKTGDADLYPDFSESDIATLKDLSAQGILKFRVVPSADFEHYFFNMGTTAGVNGKGKADVNGFCPFKDIRVRKAITLGINRQAFVDNLLSGETIVPATQWPNSSWTNTNLKADAYDPVTAEALLDQAGYVKGEDGIRHGPCNGVDTRLSFNFETTNKQIREDIALAVQSDLLKIGIDFKPIHTPAGTFFATYAENGVLYHGNYDMAGFTTGFYPDPYTTSFYCSEIPNAENGGTGGNTYLLCDPQLDRLFDTVNESANPAIRKKAIDSVQKYIFDNYYVVMMYARANVYGFSNRFLPADYGFFSNIFWNAEDWDVTQ